MELAVLIQAVADSYGPDDCADRTMTVGTLIDYLSDYDPEVPVMVVRDGGFSNQYGAIGDNDLYQIKFSASDVIPEWEDEFFEADEW